MKRLLMSTMLALPACGVTPPASIGPTPPPAATGIVAKAETVILTGERAFAAAEIGYITTAHAIAILVDNGAIKGALAAQIRALNVHARQILMNGKAATNAVDKARAAVDLFGITDRINALAPRSN